MSKPVIPNDGSDKSTMKRKQSNFNVIPDEYFGDGNIVHVPAQTITLPTFLKTTHLFIRRYGE